MGEGRDDPLQADLAAARPRHDIEDKRLKASVKQRLFGVDEERVRVDRFQIVDRVGAGAAGIVYKAYDPTLDRLVALKLVRPRGEGAEARRELLAEARAAAALSHPNVVTVFEAGEVEHDVFIALEFVDGETLADWAEPGRSWDHVVPLMIEAARGLRAAHQRGLVHRDFKPANVLVDSNKRVRVADFGLAVSTATESRAGTPAYMSPEQHRGEPADARSDQFGFGVTLYELLYGRRPFAGQTQDELLAAIDAGPRPGDAGVPAWVHAIAVRCMAPAASDRFADMSDVIEALASDPRARRRRWLAGGALLVVGAVLASIIWSSLDRDAETCTAPRPDRGWETKAKGAFESTGLAFASTSWGYAQRSLRDYGEQIRTARLEACKETRAKRQSADLLDAQSACLDRRSAALAAATELFGQADAAIVRRSARLISALPDIDDCSNRAALGHRQPLPGDPNLRAAIGDAFTTLTEVKAAMQVNRLDTANQALTELQPKVSKLAYAPLTSALLHARAQLAEAKGSQKRGAALLSRAFAEALAGRDERAAADAAIALVYNYAYWHRDRDRAATWGDVADSLVRAHGTDPSLRARLEETLGTAATLRGAHDDAVKRYERASELRKRVGRDAYLENRIALNLSAALVRMKRFDEANALLRKTIPAVTESFGATHPLVGSLLHNLGANLRSQQKWKEALPVLRKALAVKRAAFGKDHPALASTLSTLAATLADGGDAAASVAPLERSLQLIEKQAGANNLRLVNPLINLGLTHLDLSQWERAKAAGRRAAEILVAKYGKNYYDLSSPLSIQAGAFLGQGKTVRALELFTQARAIYRDGKNMLWDRGTADFGIARALAALRRDRARQLELARKALEVFRKLNDKPSIKKTEAFLGKN